MIRSRNSILQGIDWGLIGLYLLLVLMGWITVYAATFNEEHSSIFDVSQIYGKQMIFIGVSILIGIALLFFETKFFVSFAFPIYGATILLLALVLVIGDNTNGAKSWFKITEQIKIQPSEFAKYGTTLAMSAFLSFAGGQLKSIKTRVIILGILALPAGLIALQPDMGSTIVYLSFIFVLYREGLSGNFLLSGLFGIVLFILALLYQQQELVVAMTGLFVILYAMIYSDWRFFLVALGISGVMIFLVGQLNLAPLMVVGLIIGLAAFQIALNYFRKSVKFKQGRIVLTALFIIAVGFVSSVNYVFNNVLKEHQRTRITVLLGEEDNLTEQIKQLEAERKELAADNARRKELKTAIREKKKSLDALKKGAGWNVNQSLIAIGSGEVTGKGFLQSTQTKYDYVPEQSTDFIFCTVGEEWGFLGAGFVILVFVVFLIWIIIVAERQRSPFSRVYGYSVAAIFFFHFAINVAMVLGLAPVIGIPLPFFSKGGSSMIAFSLLLFTLIRLDADRKHILA